MKTTSLLAFVSLCLLTGDVNAAEFPTASVTDGIIVCDSVTLSLENAMKLRAAGVSGVRAAFYWGALEDANGPVWDTYDTFVTNCAQAGLRVYANFENLNPVYYQNPYNPDTQPDQYNAYAANYVDSPDFRNPCDHFIQTTVSHYTTLANTLSQQYTNWNPQFTWELWNEPNLDFWPGHSADAFMDFAVGPVVPGQNENYTQGALQLIRDTAAAVGGVAGSPTIVAPGVAMPHVDGCTDAIPYLQTCIARGLLDKVDGISVHPYLFWDAPENAIAYYDAVRSLSGDIRSTTDTSGIPIVDAEWGYVSEAVGLQTQADYLQRTMLVNFSQNIPISLWFMSVDMSYNDWTFGLFEEGVPWGGPWGAAKPAYYAMKTLTRNLQGATYVGPLGQTNADDWCQIYHQTIAPGWTRELAVAWNAADQVSVESNDYYGTYLLNGTPLYMGQQLPWQGGDDNWSSSTGWYGGQWPNFADYLNYTAKFTQSNTVKVDGEYRIGGIQVTNGTVTLNANGTNPSKLRFAAGSGNIYVANGSSITINTELADAVDRSPSDDLTAYTNTPETCVLRKCGTGTLFLGKKNTIHCGLLIGQGTVQLNDFEAATNMAVDIESVTVGTTIDHGHLTFGARGTYYLGSLAGTETLDLKAGVNAVNLCVGSNNSTTFYSGQITGTGSLQKQGAGDLVLTNTSNSNPNTYSGGTTIYGGSVVMGHAQALGNASSAIILDGGALGLNGYDLSTHPLTIDVRGGGLVNWNQGTTSTVSSASVTLKSDVYVNGSGAITLNSAFGHSTTKRTLATDCAQLTLSGAADNANLALVVAGGTVLLGKTDTTSSMHAAGCIDRIDTDAMVRYTGSGYYQVSGYGSITLTGGTIDFNGCYQMDTSMNITDAGSTIANTNSSGWSGYYPSSITASTGFNVDSASVLDLSTTITGSGVWLQKFGSGQLWLSGGTANTGLGLIANAGDIYLNKTNTTAADGLVAAFSGGRVLYTNTDNQVTQNGQFDLWGGTIDFNGHFQSGTSMNVYTPGSTIANTAANTLMCYSPTSIAVNGTHAFTTALNTFTVDVASNSLLDLPTGIVCDTDNNTVWPTMAKTGAGTVMLGGGAVANTNLTVDAREGTVVFNKVSSAANYIYSALAVSVQAGATVQYAGSGDGQVAQTGGWIHLNGGTLDFHGMSQTGTALTVIAGSSGSTLANTAATNSTYSPSSATLDANLTVNGGGNLSVPTAMTGVGKLTKDGTGTLTLSRANTYSGGTTIKAGTLLADFTASGAPTTNILPNTGALTLSGGTLITKFSSASSGQTVASTTVSSGGSGVTANNAAKTLSLSAITRNTAGGTVNFSTANSANIRISTANSNFTGGRQSILGGYATFGGNTWAVSGTGTGPWNITGLGTFQTTFDATNDVDAPTGTSTISANRTINSLRFNQSLNTSTVSINSNRTLTVATGGILETSTVGTKSVTISGANLTTGNGKDLIVHQNNPNASMTISANISGSGLGLTKSGVGNLILSGTKNFNGVTTVNGGTLTLSSTGNINAVNGVVMLNTGGTLLQNSGTALTRSITFNGGTLGGSGQYSGNINMDSSSGHLSPGAAGVGSIGTLTIGGTGNTGNVTLGSASVLDFDLTNTTAGNYDVLALSGTSRNLTLDGTINITSSTGVTAGNYPIITGITGTFVDNILNFGAVPSGHSSWTYYKDGSTLYVHAAPEPGTIVLLITALLSLAAYAWRRGRGGK